MEAFYGYVYRCRRCPCPARSVRVNDNATGDATDQYLPILAVAPSGRVDVAYYD